MYEFSYKKPGTLDEAAAQFSAGDDPLLMAGGQTIIPTLKQRLASPSDVIDISKLAELKGIARVGDAIVIGAGETHNDVATSDVVLDAIPGLAALAVEIGDPAVRHRGTLGGSIANADPTADYPAALLALGATVTTASREIAAEDFFIDLFETALEEGEIVTKVSFPIPEASGYVKFPNPASRYAIVGSFVAKTSAGVRVGITGAGPKAYRASDLEAALGADFSASALDSVSVSADGLNQDLHASAEYRANLVKVMTGRAVEACV